MFRAVRALRIKIVYSSRLKFIPASRVKFIPASRFKPVRAGRFLLFRLIGSVLHSWRVFYKILGVTGFSFLRVRRRKPEHHGGAALRERHGDLRRGGTALRGGRDPNTAEGLHYASGTRRSDRSASNGNGSERDETKQNETDRNKMKQIGNGGAYAVLS